MKTGVIFLHGNNTDLRYASQYCKAADIVVCADGGAEHAMKLGIIPNAIVGDLDSLPSSTQKTLPKTIKIIEYPREKDYTDSELAIEYAIEQGVDTIIIFGYLGDRFDHMMANLFHFSQYQIPITIIEGTQQYSFIKASATFTGKLGDEISLIPLTRSCEGITTEGLKYKLMNDNLTYGSTRGISNVFIENTAIISMKKGILLSIYREVSSAS